MSSGMNCQNCGKGVMYGHNVSHAKNRTKRTFAPNLHPARIKIDGVFKRVRLCVKCLRMLKKSDVKTAKLESTPAIATV